MHYVNHQVTEETKLPSGFFITVLFTGTFSLQQRAAQHQRPGSSTRPLVVHAGSRVSPDAAASGAGYRGHAGRGVAASGVHHNGTAGRADVVSSSLSSACCQALADHAEHAHKRSGLAVDSFGCLGVLLLLFSSVCI